MSSSQAMKNAVNSFLTYLTELLAKTKKRGWRWPSNNTVDTDGMGETGAMLLSEHLDKVEAASQNACKHRDKAIKAYDRGDFLRCVQFAHQACATAEMANRNTRAEVYRDIRRVLAKSRGVIPRKTPIIEVLRQLLRVYKSKS